MRVFLRYADLIRIEDLLLDSLGKMRRAAERGHRGEPLIEESEETLERVREGIEESEAGGLSVDP